MLGPKKIQLKTCKVKPGEKAFCAFHLDLIGLSAKALSVSKTELSNFNKKAAPLSNFNHHKINLKADRTWNL